MTVQKEVDELREEVERLREAIEHLQGENQQLKKALLNARDSAPIKRVSHRRVEELASKACMTLTRCGNLWLLRMGNLFRKFRFLREVWELLSDGDWVLSDIFPPQELAKEIGMVVSEERGRFLLKKNHMASTFRSLDNLWSHIVGRCNDSLSDALKLLQMWGERYWEEKRNRYLTKLSINQSK